jgi:hypothetical protein
MHCIIGNDPVWSGPPDPDRIRKLEARRAASLKFNIVAIERALANLGLAPDVLASQLAALKSEAAEHELVQAQAELARAEAELSAALTASLKAAKATATGGARRSK